MMRIGIISGSGDAGKGSTPDLEAAIRRLRHTPVHFYVDTASVRMGSTGLRVMDRSERSDPKEARFDAALLRGIGIVKDYEQYEHRIWTVASLELNGACVMNRIGSWIPAGDKFSTLVRLSRAGLPVPDTVSSEDFFAGYEAAKEFKSSVVKPLRSGMGLGIFKADDPDAAMHIFNAFTCMNKPIYVQRFLEKKNGGDYRVVVVGGEAIGAEFRKGRTWKSNVAQGAVPRRARLTAELAELAIRATRTMDLDFAGVDIAETKDGYFILETNPSMRWAGFREVTGVDPAERIVGHLLEKART